MVRVGLVGNGNATHLVYDDGDGSPLRTKCGAEKRGGKIQITGPRVGSDPYPTCYRCRPPRRGKGY